jgi:uncharacterized protein YukE
MAGFRVEPGELRDRAWRLRSAAETLRGVAGGPDGGGLEGGRGLQGGLDEALARFGEAWRAGHARLAERTEDVAERLVRAAEMYAEVDREVARGAGA